MSAKEMFEKLGFTDLGIEFGILTYGIEVMGIANGKSIVFDLNNKTYIADDYYDPMEINIDIHNAITQQMKELGWI